MKFPIFTSLAQSLVLRESSQQFRLQEENLEDDVSRLELKLATLQEELQKKKERVQVMDSLKSDKALASLDDPTALASHLKDAMAEVEPVAIFAASLTSDNLQGMATSAAAAAEELKKAAELADAVAATTARG